MSFPSKRIGLYLMAVSAAGLLVAAVSAKSHSAETAQAGRSVMKLDIQTGCQNGDATFRVKNTGSAWPRASTFSIYRLSQSGGNIISKRRMRLSTGQQASFRIKAARNTTGQLGLSVAPGWYTKAKGYDATLECR